MDETPSQARSLARLLSCALLAGMVARPVLAAGTVDHPAGAHVEVRGARLWVEREGKGEPLVLVAGGPGLSHAYFHPWFAQLGQGFEVIYFDALGCGKSSRASSPAQYSLADDVENLEALRKALAVGSINVLGHSYGGMVALAHAAKYPQSVRRLVLANAVASGEELQEVQDYWNTQFRNQVPDAWAKVEALRRNGVRSSAAEHQEAYAMPGALLFFRDASNALKQPFAEKDLYNPHHWYSMAGNDADFEVAGELRRFDMRKDIARLAMPVLVLAGRFDRVVFPGLAVRYRTYAPRARFEMFEKAGHFTFIEDPDATFALLRAFLKE